MTNPYKSPPEFTSETSRTFAIAAMLFGVLALLCFVGAVGELIVSLLTFLSANVNSGEPVFNVVTRVLRLSLAVASGATAWAFYRGRLTTAFVLASISLAVLGWHVAS